MHQESNPLLIEQVQPLEPITGVETLDVDAEFKRLTDEISVSIDAEVKEQLASAPQRKAGHPPEKGWGYF